MVCPQILSFLLMIRLCFLVIHDSVFATSELSSDLARKKTVSFMVEHEF